MSESTGYKIQFVDRILDPVHGFIDLTQVEKEIVELPIFKRMQSLKQLSLTNWVFPGAEHTRYMHSLGVMYIADLMALNLKTESGQPFFNDEQRQLLRLAGLLHDIGHYPLSHVTEYAYMSNLEDFDSSLLQYNMKVKNTIDSLKEEEKVSDYMKSRKSKRLHHETMGTVVIENDDDIKRIINKYCPFVDINDITDIIVGCVDRNPSISAMVQLIHSELDADGIDYVMRDATFSGTSYGGFELGLLLRNLVTRKYNGVDIVGVRPKGISVADQYLISKYFAYTQVIMNRHVMIYGKMAEIFTKHLIKEKQYPSQDRLRKDVVLHSKNDIFLKFTDRTFWGSVDNLEEKYLDGYAPEYVVKTRNNLLKYQEFDTEKNGEFVITSNDRTKVYNEVVKTDIYSKLLSTSEDRLMIFQDRAFTTEVKENRYRETLSRLTAKKDETISEERFVSKNVARLQEGIPIIETDKDLKLLVDDPRSIMSHLGDTHTYILREYLIR